MLMTKLCTSKNHIENNFEYFKGYSRGTNNKGVCNMIRTRPSVHSL